MAKVSGQITELENLVSGTSQRFKNIQQAFKDAGEVAVDALIAQPTKRLEQENVELKKEVKRVREKQESQAKKIQDTDKNTLLYQYKNALLLSKNTSPEYRKQLQAKIPKEYLADPQFVSNLNKANAEVDVGFATQASRMKEKQQARQEAQQKIVDATQKRTALYRYKNALVLGGENTSSRRQELRKDIPKEYFSDPKFLSDLNQVEAELSVVFENKLLHEQAKEEALKRMVNRSDKATALYRYKNELMLSKDNSLERREELLKEMPKEYMEDTQFLSDLNKANAEVDVTFAKRDFKKQLGESRKHQYEEVGKNIALNGEFKSKKDIDQRINSAFIDTGISELERNNVYKSIVNNVENMNDLKKFAEALGGKGKDNQYTFSEDSDVDFAVRDRINTKLEAGKRLMTARAEAEKKDAYNAISIGAYDQVSEYGKEKFKNEIDYAREINITLMNTDEMEEAKSGATQAQKNLLETAKTNFVKDFTQDWIAADIKRGREIQPEPVVFDPNDFNTTLLSMDKRLDFFRNEEMPFWKFDENVTNPLTQTERGVFQNYYDSLSRIQKAHMEESFAKKYSDVNGSKMLSSFMPNVNVMHQTMYSDVVKNDFIKAKDISKPSGKFSIKLIDVGKNYLGSDITDTPIVFEAAQQLVANHMMQGEDAKADEFSPEQVQNGYNAMFDNVYFQGRKYSVIRNRNNNSAETITRKLLELLPKEEIDSLPKFSGVEGALSLQQLDFGSFAIMKQIHTGKDKGFYTLQDDNGNPIVVNVN